MNKKMPILKIGYFAKLLNLSSQSDNDQKQVYAPKIPASLPRVALTILTAGLFLYPYS